MSAKKIRKSQQPVLSAPAAAKTEEDGGVVFGFDWMTAKESHNLSYFEKRNGTGQVQKLFENLQDWSGCTWVQLARRSKRNGYETIPLSEFKADISDKVPGGLTPDTKVFIFRFGDCRLAGVKTEDYHSELKVLGFDWDFSLYDHGS